MAWYQHQQRFTIAASGTASFSLPASRTPLDSLTVWASSGGRSVTMTFQPRLNGKNFGSAVTVTGTQAADPVFSSGGATNENRLFPSVRPGVFDRLDFDVLITNGGASTASVTLYAVAVEHAP